MINLIKSFFVKRKLKEKVKKELNKQGCVCYCKRCGKPFLDKTEAILLSSDGIYSYECSHCEEVSIFHFGIAPCPILIGREDLEDYSEEV